MSSQQQVQTAAKWLVIIMLLLTFLAITSSLIRYLFAHEYNFFVETSCDPEINICFIRDCEEYCPPNELEYYRTFSIPANLFEECTDNSCQNICLHENSNNLCKEVQCDIDNGDDCSK